MSHPILPPRLVFGLRGARLAAEDYRTELDVSWMQLNLHDSPVESGLALAQAQPPITAFVSLPGSADQARALAFLAEHSDAVEGWRCEVREPLVAPSPGSGERFEALANVAVLRKPAELDYDQWHRHWYGVHTEIACRTQATFGYVQNRVLEPLTEASAGVDAVVEELFPMAALSDMHAFYGSNGDDEELGRRLTELMASVAQLGADQGLDLVPTSRYVWGE